MPDPRVSKASIGGPFVGRRAYRHGACRSVQSLGAFMLADRDGIADAEPSEHVAAIQGVDGAVAVHVVLA